MTETTAEKGNSNPKRRNAARCLECSTVVESKSQYDFQTCSCGAIFVDGGDAYQRFGWTEGKRYELL